MPRRKWARYGLPWAVAAIVSGCSMLGFDEPTSFGNECTWNPDSCRYEGSYEPDEEVYAEQEARRLNRAALERLRRGSRW